MKALLLGLTLFLVIAGAEAGLEEANGAGPLYVVAMGPDGAQSHVSVDYGLYVRAEVPTWGIHGELVGAEGCAAVLNGVDQVGAWSGYVHLGVGQKDCSFRVLFTATDGGPALASFLFVGNVVQDPTLSVWVPLLVYVAMLVAAAVWGNPVMLILSLVGVLGEFTDTELLPASVIFIFSAVTTVAVALPSQAKRLLATWRERKERREQK